MDSHSPSPTPKTLTFDSSRLFDSALKSFSQQCLQPLLPPPQSLPPFPSDFPHSKLIPKSRFAVDAFRHAGDYSVSHFLSHFHSDHYGGLGPNWSSGIVYCSDITARLLVEVLKVSPLFVVALPLSTPIVIDRCEVTLIDANHCPGAVQFLFKMSDGNGKIEKYVHTGDFRFCDSMILDPILAQFVGSDAVFLDTTYCNPKFVFPSQEESISYIVNAVERIGDENEVSAKSVLFLVATYVIGKEKILLDIANRCNRKIHVDSRKMSVLRVLGHEEGGVFTENESESDVHVIGWNVLGETWPYFRPNFVKMREIMFEKGYNKVVGFVPTGWTYEVKNNKFSVRSKESLEIHLVPYSEHSNYNELRKFVKYLRPKRVVPTVGLDVEKLDSKHANKMRKHFADLVDAVANKQDFLSVFHRGTREMVDKVEKHVSSTLNEELEGENVKILSDMKSTCEADPCFVIETPSVSCVDLRDSTVLNDDDVEKYVCELRKCLPTWVTRNQMIDLINSSEGNVVEAVSNFYEREIQFSEECFASAACVSIPQTQTSTAKDPPSISKEYDTKRRQCGIIGIPLTKGCISPGKRKRDVQKKTNKAIKMNSTLHTSGSKQSTITSFFCKVASDVNNDEIVASTIKQSSKDQKLPFVTARYAEKVDQFIQIINGGESSKTFAASVLEKTNGDINQALNLYYTNPDARITHDKENMSFDRKLVDAERNNDKCFSSQEKVMPENSLAVAFVSRKLIEKADTTLVSLPPENYDPINHACWSSGQPAPYIHLARTFELLENEKGKIKATSMLCNMFRSLLALYPEDVLPAVYLCTNKISSDHENMELNVGGSLVVAALEETCGTSRLKVTEMYNKLGDLGDVAQACRQTQRCLLPPSPLLVKDLLSALREISLQTGSGSTARKKGLIANLMCSCREKEMKFLVRTLVRNLRIGAMLRTVLPALAQAVLMNSSLNCHVEGTMGNLKEKLQCLSSAVVDAYNVLPSLDLIVPSLMDKGIVFSSKTLSMIPGIPIKPMLAKITNGVSQALKLFQNKAFTCEYKYDGQRAQIHKLDDGSVHVFSRNGDETTSRFPDLICIIKEACKPNAATFILDAEVVAVDRKYGGKLMSFQELSSRGRGGRDSLITIDDIKIIDEDVGYSGYGLETIKPSTFRVNLKSYSLYYPVDVLRNCPSRGGQVDICVFVFDIMFANGEQLLGLSLRHRRTYLKEMFCDERLGYFEYAKEVTVEKDDACSNSEATLAKISSFLENAFQSSCEGIMIKSLDVDAGYFPSKRSDSWLKVKRDYLDGVNDSLDLVPVGAWYGNGRKAGWFSPFLMACYNPETEEFQSVCRVMSGFSDGFYIEMKEFFHGSKILSRKPPYYCTGEMPDMWFSAEVVWEIRGADFTVSPVHHAAIGLVHPTRGISVRFPRFIRVLPDRSPEECSTADDIAEMFNSQTRKMDVSTHD